MFDGDGGAMIDDMLRVVDDALQSYGSSWNKSDTVVMETLIVVVDVVDVVGSDMVVGRGSPDGASVMMMVCRESWNGVWLTVVSIAIVTRLTRVFAVRR